MNGKIETYGADPELMLYDTVKNKIVSAIGVLKNDKYTPIELPMGIMMYADNVLVEFSFPPCRDHASFVESLRNALQYGQNHLGPRYRFIAKAAHVYDDEELADPKALEGGCSPNFDVYAGAPNMPPKFEGGLRTGSFHIHIGSDQLQTRETKDAMIKYLDLCLGVPSLVFDHDSTSQQRRKLYGKAGEFRPTPYGVEYRVLGPYALRSPRLVSLCLNLVDLAFQAANVGEPELRVDNIINSHDVEVATEFVHTYLNGYVMEITAVEPPDLYRDWKISI